jgi:hypothetical protein
MDKGLRLKLGKKADDLGFDSPQALLRYVSKAIVDGRQVTFGSAAEVDYAVSRDKEGWDDWGPVPKHVLKRWAAESVEHEADRRAGKVKSFDTAEEALKYLHSL